MGTNHPKEFGRWKFERDRDAPYYRKEIEKKKQRLERVFEQIRKWERRKSGVNKLTYFRKQARRLRARGKRKAIPKAVQLARADRNKALEIWKNLYKKLEDGKFFDRSFLTLHYWEPKSRRYWPVNKFLLRMIIKLPEEDLLSDKDLADSYHKDYWWFDEEDIEQEYLSALWEVTLSRPEAPEFYLMMFASLRSHDNTWFIRRQARTYRTIRELLEVYPDCGYETFDGVSYMESRSFWKYRAKHAYGEDGGFSMYLSSLGLLPIDYSLHSFTWLHYPQQFLKRKPMGYEKNQERWEIPLLTIIQHGNLNKRLTEGDNNGSGPTSMEAKSDNGYGAGGKDETT